MTNLLESTSESLASGPVSRQPELLSQSELTQLRKLSEILESPLAVYSGSTKQTTFVASSSSCQAPPLGDTVLISELCRVVGRLKHPEIIYEEGPLALLAIPLPPAFSHDIATKDQIVAIAPLILESQTTAEDYIASGRLLDVSSGEIACWAQSQKTTSVDRAQLLVKLWLECQSARQKAEQLESEDESLCEHLSFAYEELNVLYGVTQNLHISRTEEEIGRLALDWLSEVIPAQMLTIQYLPVADKGKVSHNLRTESLGLTQGEGPNEFEIDRLTELLGEKTQQGPLIINHASSRVPDWPFEDIEQLILIGLRSGDTLYGWVAAINHDAEGEFGTIEASLLNSVATILAIHSGNLDLFHQQSEFLASTVRALTSAVDAKDTYTCGHSDRVARIAVLIAKELGCTAEQLNTIYLGGLLHDVGKIGIEDTVLRKTSQLSLTEFEHIKQHPDMGYKILLELQQLSDTLPIVRYHHERWDGDGYPERLKGEEIPVLARVVAVADAYDAMTSDRPYRDGMPINRVAEILKAGAGTQWDSQVVNAFFGVQDQIEAITNSDRADLAIDVQQWT